MVNKSNTNLDNLTLKSIDKILPSNCSLVFDTNENFTNPRRLHVFDDVFRHGDQFEFYVSVVTEPGGGILDAELYLSALGDIIQVGKDAR